GNNALAFIGNNTIILGQQTAMSSDSVLFVDNDCSFGGVTIRPFEAKNIIFGRDCMFSWNTVVTSTDHHLIMDCNTNNRVNYSKSVYVGDHVWCGMETTISKGAFIASGAILGAKSLATKIYYSNTANAGIPSKELKKELFWLRDSPFAGQWTKEQTLKHSNIPNDNFKYTYNQNEFLSPKAIEEKLDSLNTAQEKLEFVYDAIYMNKNKNRFAYFKDMPYDIPLPKYESKFKLLKFEEIEPTPPKPTTPPQPAQPTPQEQINSLKEEINKKDIEIKNLEITNQKAQNIKNHLSYKLGNALIKAHKQWYKGGYIKFIFEAIKIQNEHNKTKI
ncbi:acyltransferase, partial [Campylobacter lanienae]|uniref:acyltransferase n=1 Tax=Campylobacter lanienae TaxID=75658 RepID=UPI003AFB11AD